MLLKNALQYSDKVRRRSWRPECHLVVGDGTAVDENGSDCHGYYDLEIELERFDDWEPVPLPGDITILCRGCGEEFYGMLVPEGEYKFWTVRKQREHDVSIDLFCPECDHVYFCS